LDDPEAPVGTVVAAVLIGLMLLSVLIFGS
jgi:hypothetical protein